MHCCEIRSAPFSVLVDRYEAQVRKMQCGSCNHRSILTAGSSSALGITKSAVFLGLEMSAISVTGDVLVIKPIRCLAPPGRPPCALHSPQPAACSFQAIKDVIGKTPKKPPPREDVDR